MQEQPVDVLKFGGSCLSSADDFRTAVRITASYGNPVVVVSAMSGITQRLQDLCAAGEINRAMDIMGEIKRIHLESLSGISDTPAGDSVAVDLETLFGELANIVGTNMPETMEIVKPLVMSYGEKLSSIVMKAHLAAAGREAESVFSDEIIVASDENPLDATVDTELTGELINDRISKLMESHIIPVITGFFCMSPTGRTVLLGRNSSDYTAALVAGSLRGCRLTFWKDVPGLMTGDPKFVRECTVLRHISYDDADSYIKNGAKILHGKVVPIARQGQIPIGIRDFRNPETPGTLISGYAGISQPSGSISS